MSIYIYICIPYCRFPGRPLCGGPALVVRPTPPIPRLRCSGPALVVGRVRTITDYCYLLDYSSETLTSFFVTFRLGSLVWEL